MRSLSLALAVGGALLSHVSAQNVGVGLPCVDGTPDVCLNADVTSLTDPNANVVLTCVNGVYTSTLCAAGQACQGGTCVILNIPNTSNPITITTFPTTTTTATTTATPSPSTPAVVAVGVPCIVGIDQNVCLNANVVTLADSNANVILECVDGAYAALLCPSGQGCQNGACVVLLAAPNSNTASTTAPTSAPGAGGVPSSPGGVSNTGSAGLPAPVSTAPVVGDTAPTGRPAPSSDTGALQPASRYPPNINSYYDGLGPEGRPGYYPVTTTVTDYVTVSQCWNGVWETATFCEVRPICGCAADTPIPTYVYLTTTQATNTIIYPYCEACETQTECVMPTPAACSTCKASTITIACSTTPNVPVSTCTMSNSQTTTYAPPTSAAPTEAAVTSQVATPTIAIFKSGAGAVVVKGSVVALAIAVAAAFF